MFFSNIYFYNELFAFMYYFFCDVSVLFCEYIIPILLLFSILNIFIHLFLSSFLFVLTFFLLDAYFLVNWNEVKPFINNTWSIFHKRNLCKHETIRWNTLGNFIMIYFMLLNFYLLLVLSINFMFEYKCSGIWSGVFLFDLEFLIFRSVLCLSIAKYIYRLSKK